MLRRSAEIIQRKFVGLIRYIHDNGMYLLSCRILVAIPRTSRDWFLSRKLKCQKLRLGAHPRISGLSNISIGRNFSSGNALWLEAVTYYRGKRYSPHISIGNNVSLSDAVHIACTNSVTIGDDVLIGSRVIITDHNHGTYGGHNQSSPLDPPSNRELTNDRSTIIENRAWIGDGVAILAGAAIGEGSIIAANSVVVGNIPKNCIATGSPAKPIRVYDFARKEWIRAECDDCSDPVNIRIRDTR